MNEQAPLFASNGRFARNILHFARALRAAGLPVGPARVVEALRAVEAVGVRSRQDLYWTLFAVFVNRQDQREIFDQCFHIFWRDPKILERLMRLLLPELAPDLQPQPEERALRRVAEAFAGPRGRGTDAGEEARPPEVERDAWMTWSDREQLRKKDFEQMTAEELALARREIERLALMLFAVPTRRFAPHPRGSRIDLRRSLRRSLRGGAAAIELVRRGPVVQPPPLVVLCDISGSMGRYSRMLLLFLHTLTGCRERVHSFVFGTRLTNITRYLRKRDVDAALERVGEVVQDWGGGTRIGRCLRQFNRLWSRRVLAQGAVVLLITDGLDRDAGRGLEAEVERLHKSARRLIWLNPLLRFDAYAPISKGARILIRHVDEFRSVHNLESLQQLAAALARDGIRRPADMARWLRMADRAEVDG